MTAPASPTTTTRKRSANSPSTPASCTSNTRASTSTCSTRPAIPISSAPPSAPSSAVENGRHRHLGRQRHRGQHPPHVQRGRQARPGPHARHQQARRRQHPLRRTAQDHSATPSARPACCSTPRSTSARTSAASSACSIRPTPPPAGCPVDLAAARSQLDRRHRRERRGADGEIPRSKAPISDEELAAALPKALAAGTVIPIFCTVRQEGHRHRRVARRPSPTYALSPAQGKTRTATKGTATTRRGRRWSPIAVGEFVGQVFKTLTDKFVGNLSFFRVFSGKLHAGAAAGQRAHRQVGAHRRPAAHAGQDARQPITEAIPGDIVAVAKVEDLHIGDTVGNHASAPEAAARRPSRRRCSAWPSNPRRAATSRRSPAACTRSPTRTRPSRSRATRRPRRWSSPA